MLESLKQPAPAAPLRFRGNRANPNYAAVAHLLRTYACHLGIGWEDVSGPDASGPVDILWDRGPAETPGGACLIFPGRPSAVAETLCGRTRSGYPVPLSGWQPAGAGRAKGTVLETAAGFSLAWEGPEGWNLHSDWDLLSFCADILFRRADHLPARRREAGEAIGVGQ